jgi:hypothetical protein
VWNAIQNHSGGSSASPQFSNSVPTEEAAKGSEDNDQHNGCWVVTRPYILGLSQPQPNAPPLCPRVPGTAGNRLWAMVNEVSGITQNEWLSSTQRVNLLTDAVLPRDYRGAARRRGEFLGPLIRVRTVVLLGSDVSYAVGHDLPPLVWAEDRDWIMVPHPSGKNLWYNNPIHRLAVGILLTDVLRGPAIVRSLSDA